MYRTTASALIFAICASGHTHAQVDPIREFYIPIDEQHIRDWADAINPNANNGTTSEQVRSFTSLVFSTDGAIVYYDHWEDGYEADITSPAQASTEIWGDADAGNGTPPGCAVAACDRIAASDLIILDNNVQLPRNSGTRYDDARDYIASTGAVVVSRHGFRLQEGELLGGASEVFPVASWGTSFMAPIGEDITSHDMFSYTALSVIASADATTVQVDRDGSGPILPEPPQVLNRGESLFVGDLATQGNGIHTGATITANNPIQAYLVTGDRDTEYAGRWYSLIPTSDWSSDYYTPAGSSDPTPADDDQATFIIVHNPDTSNAITVTRETRVGGVVQTGTFSVPAGGHFNYRMPQDSGGHFYTVGGETFYALTAVDFDNTASDWGFPLIPSSQLTTGVVVGLGWGQVNPNPPPAENSSPVWVTAIDDTTLFIDYDSDPTTGSLVDANGDLYDVQQPISRLESLKLLDTNDGDQSQMKVYTLDGTLITAAWGQDPATASPANPALDMGTFVLPFPDIDVTKEGVLIFDVDGDGAMDPGDTIQYTIVVVNNGVSSNEAILEDTLDPNTTYVPNTVEVDGVPLADDMAPATAFPLDNDGINTGYNMGVLAPLQMVTFTFEVTINNPFPPGVDGLVNHVRVTASEEVVADTALSVIGDPGLTIAKVSDASGPVASDDTLTYTITVTNTSASPATAVEVLDIVPGNATYVTESTVVQAPSTQETWRDEFDAQSYANNNGTQNWTTNWIEIDPNGLDVNGVGSQNGQVLTVFGFSPDCNGGFCLAITGDYSASAPNITDMALGRQADLTGAVTATLSFTHSHFGLFGGPHGSIALQVRAGTSGAWTTLDTFNYGVSNSFDNFESYDISAFISGATQIRFFGSGNATGARSFDDVQILGQYYQTLTNQSGASNPLVDGNPQNLVRPADGIILPAGLSMFVEYQATVDGPPAPGNANVINTAIASTAEVPNPQYAVVSDPLHSGVVSGRVWLDADGDGFEDIVEPGIGSVTVSLVDPGGDGMPGGGDDTVLYSQATDANGEYAFYYLPAGNYYVDVTDGDIPSGLTLSPGSSDPRAVFALAAAEHRMDEDFGYRPENPTTDSAIGDTVFADANGNGVQDAGEIGIGNVTVQLINAQTGAAGPSTTTDSMGRYLFTGVSPGQWQVRVTDTNNVLTTYTNTTGGINSTPVSLFAGESSLEADFGYDRATLYSITDRVWSDRDGDGTFDATEKGIAGTTVKLLDSGGNLRAVAATDENGEFSFSGLPDGDYTVVIVDAADTLQGLNGTTSPAEAGSQSYTIAGADIDQTNFGYGRPASISGHVFSDADADMVFDRDESPIPGATVVLWRDADGDGVFDSTIDTQVGTDTTDAFGFYAFTGLAPGQYFASVDDGQAVLSSFTVTTTDEQTGGNAAGTQLDARLGIPNGGVTNVDFGYRNAALPDVSGNVWHDLDADGVDDGAGEPRLADVTIALVNSSGDVVATAVTDSSGDYSFPDVLAGDYTVKVTDEKGVLTDFLLTSGLDEIPITVAGSDITDIDFGYVRERGDAVLGGTLWLDADHDGNFQPTEGRIAGVTVELFDTGPDGMVGGGDDVSIGTTVTDANGNYVFSGLPAGSYYTNPDETTLPSGLALTMGSTDPGPVVPLSNGQKRLDINYGYVSASGSLVGDQVWSDALVNGVQDAGELGIAGVEITVALQAGGFSTTVTTDARGRWYVTGLAPGDYYAEVDTSTLPVGYDPSPTNADLTYQFTVLANRDILNLDWGFTNTAGLLGTASGTVFLDENADAMQVGEPGIAAVTVNLLDGMGNVLATTETDENGNYSFSGLPAGTYDVAVTDANGVLIGLNQTTTDPAQFILPAGGNQTGLDFGYAPSANAPIGTLGTLVWHDIDDSGDRVLVEPGMSLVTLHLWHDRNANQAIDPGTDNYLRSTVTDANGEYRFNGLVAGEYLVQLVDQNGVTQGFTKTNAANPGEDNNSQVNPYPITIDFGSSRGGGMGPTDFTADFGYHAGTGYFIAGTAFEDANNNGTLDGESGVPDVTLTLYRDLNNNGVLDASDARIGRTQAAADGTYQFDDLPAGRFLVVPDSSGSSVFGYTQTTQTGSGGIADVTIVNAPVTDVDFGYYNSGVTTLPVTLGRFASYPVADGVRVEWTTLTETANIGFVLYADQQGAVRTITPMTPSRVHDSLMPTDYALTVATSAEEFWLADVDAKGRERRHGPFKLGRTYGYTEPVSAIDWAPIRAEHAALNGGRGGGGFRAAELRVAQTGVHRVTHEQLIDAGVELNGPIEQLALTLEGEPVPIEVVAPDGQFGPGDAIYFVGRGIKTLYATENVYRLSRSGADARRVAEDISVAEVVANDAQYLFVDRRDADNAYGFASPLDDPWYDRSLLWVNGNGATASYSFDIADRIDGSPVWLDVELWGVTQQAANPDHHVRVWFNGQAVADISGDGLAPMSARVDVSGQVQATNDVTLEITGEHGLPVDLVNIEAVQLSWWRALGADDGRFASTVASTQAGPAPDVLFAGSFEANPAFVGTGVTVDGFATSDLMAYAVGERVTRLNGLVADPAGGGFSARVPLPEAAAELIITDTATVLTPAVTGVPEDSDLFAGPAQYLMIAHPHFIDGLQPLVEHHEANGMAVKVVDVEALYRHYRGGRVDAEAIRDYIRDMLGQGVQYVLLVGGDSYDYHDNLGLGSMSFVPTLYRQTADVVLYGPTDAAIADVDGDLAPDVALGRFPVRTQAELAAMINKTLQYAAKSWSRKALLSAGPFSGGQSFAAYSDELASDIPADWIVDRVYMDELDLALARQTMLDAINGGAALTSYFGHSAPTVWNFPEVLIGLNDLEGLSNEGKPTMVVQFSCWNSYFVDPHQNTIAQRFLTHGLTGAAGVAGPTALTQTDSLRLFGNQFMPSAVARGVPIGDALMVAMDALATTHPDRIDVLLGVSLLGDPALIVSD